MAEIKINHEPLESLEDFEDRKLYVKKFHELAFNAFQNIDGFIHFNYITSYNQFDIEKTNIEDAILRRGIFELENQLPNSMIA